MEDTGPIKDAIDAFINAIPDQEDALDAAEDIASHVQATIDGLEDDIRRRNG